VALAAGPSSLAAFKNLDTIHGLEEGTLRALFYLATLL
jgi:hypothetical protein